MASDHSATANSPTTHGHADAHAHYGAHGHDAHDVSKSVRKYMIIFGALLIGTIVTVLASYIDFGNPSYNIAVALFIAIVKGSLVAGYFMHLIDERKLIYGVLGATVFFFAGLMYLTLWSMEPTSLIHIKH
jgi:caa(3)-type oxidase subunit IV